MYNMRCHHRGRIVCWFLYQCRVYYTKLLSVYVYLHWFKPLLNGIRLNYKFISHLFTYCLVYGFLIYFFVVGLLLIRIISLVFLLFIRGGVCLMFLHDANTFTDIIIYNAFEMFFPSILGMSRIKLVISPDTGSLKRVVIDYGGCIIQHINRKKVTQTPPILLISLQWRHNDHDGVSNHQTYGYLLNRLFKHRSKKTSKLRVTGLCVGNSPGPVNSPHKWPVTRKMFPFDDVIMSRVRGTYDDIYFERLCNISDMSPP